MWMNIKRFGVFGIGSEEWRADKFDSVDQCWKEGLIGVR